MREQTDLRLGIEADFVPGREDRWAPCWRRRDWDYVIGSVHFLADQAVDMHGAYQGVGARRAGGEGPGSGTS